MAIWIREKERRAGFYDIRNGEGGEVIEDVLGFTVNVPNPGQPATVTLTVILDSFAIEQPMFRRHAPEGKQS